LIEQFHAAFEHEDAGRWRGRWWLERPTADRRPAAGSRESPDASMVGETLHLGRLEGQSAQAAVLCALLAATGDPYRLVRFV
jgi:hypothetical protein